MVALFQQSTKQAKPGVVASRAIGRKLRSGVLALIGLVLAGAPEAHATAPIDEQDWAAALGRGFDSKLGRIADACVSGQLEYRGNRSGRLSYHFDDSFSDYLNETSGRLSGGVNLLLIGGDARVDYYARVGRTELSTSFTMRFAAELGSGILTHRTISTEGQAAAAQSPAERRAACGDEFISEARLGTELLVSAAFHFIDANEFQRFVKTVTVEAMFGLISSTHRWVDETQSFSQSGYLKVDAYQTGGTAGQLTGLLGAAPSTLCRFDAIAPCQELLTELLAYASSPDGFAAQFSTPYRPEQFAVLGYRTARYEDSGHDDLAAPPAGPEDADIQDIIRHLSDELGLQIALRDRAGLMLSTPLAAARRVEVRDVQTKAEANIANLDRALWVCRTVAAPPSCRSARDDEAAQRLPIAFSDLLF